MIYGKLTVKGMNRSYFEKTDLQDWFWANTWSEKALLPTSEPLQDSSGSGQISYDRYKWSTKLFKTELTDAQAELY